VLVNGDVGMCLVVCGVDVDVIMIGVNDFVFVL